MNFQTYALAHLMIAEENVRATSPADDDIDALAELIAAQGLQQPLCGYRKGKTKLAIYDGRRRLLALRKLAKENRLPDDCKDGVACRIGTKDQAREASLGAGVSHKGFHPAEEFKAFAALIDDGMTVEDVAKRFSVTETHVLKRLKLARLAPPVFDAFAKDEINLSQARAYTLTDNQDWQARLFAAWGPDGAAHAIRRTLTEGEIPETDKRARYIGAANYEKAGGAIRRDLFEDSAATFCDAALLDALVDAKLETDAVAVKSEGWSWVVTSAEFDYAFYQSHLRAHPTRADFSEEDQQAYDALAAQRDRTLEGAQTEDDLSEEDYDEIERLEALLDEMEARQLTYTEEDLGSGGAVVSLRHDGTEQVTRGLIERKAVKKTQAEKSVMPHSQHRRLTEIATQGLARDLAANHRAADIVLTAALLQQAFGFGSTAGVGISVSGLSPSEGADLPVDHALAARQEHFAELIGSDLADTLTRVADLSDEDRAEAKALCIAISLDFSEGRADQRSPRARATASKIAGLVGADLSTHWIANEAFFAKLPREALVAQLVDMGKEIRSLASAKKKELVSIAVREAKAGSWTPEPARFASAPTSKKKVADAA